MPKECFTTFKETKYYNMNQNRRIFLKSTAINTLGLALIPTILSATSDKKKKNIVPGLKKNSVLLFQGDSITDSGREKEKQLPNSPASFGSGFAYLAASNLLNNYASKNFMIYNRGISGNKVFQLSDRWQKDCLDLKPDLISILIGVNDFWHKLNGRYDGTPEIYENDYRQLLILTKKIFTDVKIVIGEPFAVNGGTAISGNWFPEFDKYRNIAFKIANEFGAVFIPYQSIFNEALKYAPVSYWAADGVHPSMAGNSLMAQAWLKAVE